MAKFISTKIVLDDGLGSPLSIFQHVRSLFTESLLLECREYKDTEKTRSFVCADPICSFKSIDGKSITEFAGHSPLTAPTGDLVSEFEAFLGSLVVEQDHEEDVALFGFAGYSSIPYFEDIEFRQKDAVDVPDFSYALYRYVFVFDHSRQTLELIHTVPETETHAPAIDTEGLIERISTRQPARFRFSCLEEETSSMNDEEFLAGVDRIRTHIKRGDTFQTVLSRQFRRNYTGDEFEVYRTLRRINPSPFLFFFDYGSFSLFGSSPEAQLLVKDGEAKMFPIAGTFPRGVDAEEDRVFAEALCADPKENAEHVMLVDLARNDLGRSCHDVRVERFRETEFYSHVIHLVSLVTARVEHDKSAIRIFADTFPAGTLSGAPKHRAMQIIDEIEPVSRNLYGGSVGMFSLSGRCTQAIIIRSFTAKAGQLIYQAGAGIVDSSVPENELKEVRNKLAALRKAISLAHEEQNDTRRSGVNG
jgi:anthranilate synthase component 1